MAQTQAQTLTNDERVTYALETVSRWRDNYRINGARLAADGHTDRARVCEEHAQNLADIVAMLDGTDDAYIASVQER